MAANGGVTPNITYGTGNGSGVPVTPGDWYALSCRVYSPPGWSSGVFLRAVFYTSGGSQISFVSSSTIPLPAAATAFLQVPGPFRAPSGAAWCVILIEAAGTPAPGTGFYLAGVQLVQAYPVSAGGPQAAVTEVPYLSDAKLSSDRALLYNQANLNQYGTNTLIGFSGQSYSFTPSSGVQMVIMNQASASLRGAVPYSATLYLNNTAANLPYFLDDPSMEDFGNWIVQTLGQASLRPKTITITPVATTQATIMGLQCEVGDTATFRRRPIGVPEQRALSYVSKLSRDIDIATGKWDTKYELSGFSQGVVVRCDDVINGCLTGNNPLSWLCRD
jgi:hypothetical protein